MIQAFATHHEIFDKDRTKVVVSEYNKRAMIPLLVKVNSFLNLVASHNALEDENLFTNSLLNVTTYASKASEVMLVCEVSMFHDIVVFGEEVIEPLTWWKEHTSSFPIVFWLGMFWTYQDLKLKHNRFTLLQGNSKACKGIAL
jgi:hypothetical protein